MIEAIKNLNLYKKMVCYRQSNSKRQTQLRQFYKIWDRNY